MHLFGIKKPRWEKPLRKYMLHTKTKLKGVVQNARTKEVIHQTVSYNPTHQST